MLFTSLPFFVLVVVTFLLYYLPKLAAFQSRILILSSLLFYAWHQPYLLLLLLFSVAINILSSYGVVYGNPRYRRRYAVAGVVLNLLILAFFKYSPLLASTFLQPDSSVGAFLLLMPLPIGISFFTFQGISLVVDVYKQKYFDNRAIVPQSLALHAERIMLFKGFFPQLISGPIVKAHQFMPQIGTKYLAHIPWDIVAKQLITGYFLKMVVADNLKDFTFWIAFPYFQRIASLELLVMLLGYSCQIFADFAGYSLIAMGLASLFGYRFPENFKFPYVATSFKDFWKRWHISLSSFLMEYLYIPLGGSRKGKLRTYVNLMLVMVLGGLWHGAAWSYAVWGACHGVALAAERFVTDYVRLSQSRLLGWLRWLMVFGFVTLAWLLFKLPDFGQVLQYFAAIAQNTGLPINTGTITYIGLYSLPVFVYHIVYKLKLMEHYWFSKMAYLVYAAMLFLIVTNAGSPGAFIYFQF